MNNVKLMKVSIDLTNGCTEMRKSPSERAKNLFLLNCGVIDFFLIMLYNYTNKECTEVKNGRNREFRNDRS